MAKSIFRILSLTAVLFGVSQSASAALIGFWNFSETSGTTAHDSSGSGINGILENGATFAPGAGINGGGAVQIPGYNVVTGGDVTMGQHFDFSGTTNFSVQAWVKLAPGDTRFMLPIAKTVSGVPSGYALALNHPGVCDNCAQAFLADGRNGIYSPASTIPINDGNWHQIVGLESESDVVVYVDGVNQGSTGKVSLASSVADFVVGGANFSGANGNFFAGLITDVGVWDNALSPTEVSALFKQTTVPLPAAVWLLGPVLGGLGFARRRLV